MQIRALLRTTTFRLSALYGLIFAVGLVALLGLVYLRSAVYLTGRVDGILTIEADALQRAPPADLRVRVGEALTLNGRSNNVIGIFSATGQRVAGDLPTLPVSLTPNGRPIEMAATSMFPAPARLMARRLASGEVLVVGRDIGQLREMRAILASALIWSGGAVIMVGLACGVVFSLGPLQRLRTLQGACAEIASGDLTRRLPISGARDELDMFAGTVNLMIGEVERLMGEVKGATETIAHDLRTPLTRARAQLHRLLQSNAPEVAEIARVTAELDTVLERFRALLRISELEARDRRAGFVPTDLASVIGEVGELYQPLADAGGVRLTWSGLPGATVEADPKLLFEAVSNLVDNAIKFTGDGGTVALRLGEDPARPRIVVEDNGPGIPDAERGAVRQRFYRGERDRLAPGSGLGLSIAAAIVGLHRFTLELEDASPGLRAVIVCRAALVTH
jgi:signal transduction histidine kinase